MKSTTSLVDYNNCKKYHFAPKREDGERLSFYIDRETDINFLSILKFSLGYQPDFIMVEETRVESQIRRFFEGIEVSKRANSTPSPGNDTIDSSIIELIDNIISKAIKTRASDIHLEPFEYEMVVRYRLDGILQKIRTIKRENVPAVVSRLKIMSGLDIAEKRRPQDGRIRFKMDDKTVDIRVSILPTDFGEKMVLRILDKSAVNLDLNDLGFKGTDLDLLKQKIKLPNGIIMITGPTGSGKTTTLYSALKFINSPDINITTIEDPIEYNLEGINQTQIKPEINVTFASALRAILRQDPNVIMVGEIRDKETLDNALRAAMTGHLVFSTVHTNDSISTVARLIDLGAERYLIGSALKLIVAQRLVRKICPFCKTDKINDSEKSAARALGLSEDFSVFQGAGCERCMSIGFRGRIAIYELLPISDSVFDKIVDSNDKSKVFSLMKEAGFRTLRENGIELIKQGVTTSSEVLRETA